MGGLGCAGDMYAIHELSQAVRTRRQEIGLSQQRLATLAGLSRATIVQLEGGTLRDLSFTRTAAVLEVLGLALTIAPAHPRLGPRPVSSTPALEIAGRTASTSYRGNLSAATLGQALRTGEMPAGFEAHVFALVDEAPVALLARVVEQSTSKRAWRERRSGRPCAAGRENARAAGICGAMRRERRWPRRASTTWAASTRTTTRASRPTRRSWPPPISMTTATA